MRDPFLKPVHPGEILAEEFLEPMALSQYRLAKDIGVPAHRINEIVLGKRGITADTALRLARYFDTTPDVWLNDVNRLESNQVEDGRFASASDLQAALLFHPFRHRKSGSSRLTPKRAASMSGRQSACFLRSSVKPAARMRSNRSRP